MCSNIMHRYQPWRKQSRAVINLQLGINRHRSVSTCLVNRYPYSNAILCHQPLLYSVAVNRLAVCKVGKSFIDLLCFIDLAHSLFVILDVHYDQLVASVFATKMGSFSSMQRRSISTVSFKSLMGIIVIVFYLYTILCLYYISYSATSQ